MLKSSLNNNWSAIIIDGDKIPNKFETYSLSFLKETGYYFENVNLPCSAVQLIKDNGILEDPYFSTNVWDYQKFENSHLIFVKHFTCEENLKTLCFDGIDTLAEIYLNGKIIGKTENMFITYSFDISKIVNENNELVVHILPAVTEGNKYDVSDQYTSYLDDAGINLRKAICSFGWDIFPRLPLGGVWKDVYLCSDDDEIKDVFFKTVLLGKDVFLEVDFNARSANNLFVKIEGKCKQSAFSAFQKIDANNNSVRIKIDKPLLWNIRGYGEQNLYEVELSVCCGDEIKEVHCYKIGLRNVELKRTDIVCENGCFEFHVNGQRIFVLGMNWSPLDIITFRDDEKCEKVLQMICDLGCNAIRVWGGGVYETEYFYNRCDELGLLVWQDFMMACVTYPTDAVFAEKLRKESDFVVRRLRNHPCISIWAGDNECDTAALLALDKNPDLNVVTRKVFPEVLSKLDNTRPYLPSSPYYNGKYFTCAEDCNKFLSAENHLWARDCFKNEFYDKKYCYFASEIGFIGCPSSKSLRKFIKNVWPILGEDGNPTKEYLAHATSVIDSYESPYTLRTKLMCSTTEELFNRKFDNISDFVRASQINQAEALKSFVERFRADKERRSGIILWNIIDGWPQMSDAVVDYYLEKKLSYSYIKRSQQKVCLMVKELDKKGNCQLVAVNDTLQSVSIDYVVTRLDNGEKTSGNVVLDADGFETLDLFRFGDCKAFLLIEWTINGEKYKNHFVSNIKGVNFDKYVEYADLCGFEVSKVE